MSNRYGRKKRRKHIQEIAELKQTIYFLHQRVRMEKFAAENAKNEALKFFMESQGLMKYAIDRTSQELGRAVGKELQPHALLLFETARRIGDELPMAFSMIPSPVERKIEMLRGEIKPFFYQVALC